MRNPQQVVAVNAVNVQPRVAAPIASEDSVDFLKTQKKVYSVAMRTVNSK